jgi:hypothetical protein
MAAGLLALVFVLALVPPQFAFAYVSTIQYPVEYLYMNVVPPQSYSPKLTWQVPRLPDPVYDILPGTVDTGYDPPDLPNTTPIDPLEPGTVGQVRPAKGFRIYYRNASLGESFPTQPIWTITDVEKGGPFLPGETITHPGEDSSSSLPLADKSIYEFKVVPYNMVRYQRRVEGTAGLYYEYETRDVMGADPPAQGNNRGLFITNIKVEAEGRSDQLVVTWDNPLFNDRSPFTGWRIYWTPYDNIGDKAPIAMDGSNSVIKNISVDDVIHPNGDPTKNQYVVSDPSLQIGKFYSVKVEPLGDSMTPVRLSKTIKIGGKDYAVAYTDPNDVTSLANQYRINNASVKLGLDVDVVGSQYIKLYWDRLVSELSLYKVEIFESTTDDFTGAEPIGALYNPNAAYINYWLAEYNKNTYQKKYYQIKVYYFADPGHNEPPPGTEPGGSTDDGRALYIMYSNVAVYDPLFTAFSPYKPNILEITDDGPPPRMNVVWEAFTREPYNSLETVDQEVGKYVDKDVSYDIWVTDDPTNFDNVYFGPPIAQSVSAFTLAQLTYTNVSNNNVPKIAYTMPVTEYVGYDSSQGGFVKMPVEANKVYYYKIRAQRDNTGEYSEPAYGSHYIPPTEGVVPKPNQINKPPLHVAGVTEDSITVQWSTIWAEFYQGTGLDGDDVWYSKVYMLEDGTVVFEDDTRRMEAVAMFELDDDRAFIGIDSLTGDARQEKVRQNMLGPNDGSEMGGYIRADLRSRSFTEDIISKFIAQLRALPLRVINFGDEEAGVRQKIHVVRYEDMLDGYESYEDYLGRYLLNSDAAWGDPIEPTGGSERHPEYEVEDLEPNTSYVIFYRPFVMRNGEWMAWYPNYVTETTLYPKDELRVKPTVPVLEPVEATDTTLTVRWTASKALKYELVYSEIFEDYPEGGTRLMVDWDDEAQENWTFNLLDEKIYYTIPSLFPDTNYYIWIRSIADYSEEDEEEEGPSVPDEENEDIYMSDWSNYIMMKTLDILAPDPPRGLGPATRDSLEVYNRENDTEYSAIGEDYIVVEWMRIFDDVNNAEMDEEQPPAQTTVEGDAMYLPTPSIITTYMARFGALDMNTAHYFRAKTVYTVTRDADGEGIAKNYHYVLQMSRNPDFVDYVEIEIPAGVDLPESSREFKQKESDWCATVKIFTGMSEDEYDGDKNPDLYPLPNTDFEIIYDPASETLTYRFRSNGVAADGSHDNLVDQRFISRLVQNRTFNYEMDLTRYDAASPVSTRQVQIPYSIMRAFTERKISLSVLADNMRFTFPPGSVDTGEVLGLPDYGMGASVNIAFMTNATGTPVLEDGEVYASKPQKLQVKVLTVSKTITLDSLAKPVEVAMKLESRSAAEDNNIGAYIADGISAGWQRAGAEYNNVDGALTLATYKTANFSSVEKPLAVSAADNASLGAYFNVGAKLDVDDMGAYDSREPINANQFNNIVSSVANNRPAVTMDGMMSEQDFASLGKAKVLVSGTNVSLETGINALIKLYELKTKRPVKGYPSLEETALSGISSASQQYQTALLKADALGFFEGAISVNPRESMTMGEVMRMVDIIIADAGL